MSRSRTPTITGRPRFGEARIAPWVVRLARTLDTRYRIPGLGWRFGIDGLIGLVPVVGDLLSAAYGAVMLLEAFRLRLPVAVMGRMLWNLGVDAALGSVPVVGDAMDFFYRPNERNLRLLEAAVDRRARRGAAATIRSAAAARRRRLPERPHRRAAELETG